MKYIFHIIIIFNLKNVKNTLFKFFAYSVTILILYKWVIFNETKIICKKSFLRVKRDPLCKYAKKSIFRLPFRLPYVRIFTSDPIFTYRSIWVCTLLPSFLPI